MQISKKNVVIVIIIALSSCIYSIEYTSHGDICGIDYNNCNYISYDLICKNRFGTECSAQIVEEKSICGCCYHDEGWIDKKCTTIMDNSSRDRNNINDTIHISIADEKGNFFTILKQYLIKKEYSHAYNYKIIEYNESKADYIHIENMSSVSGFRKISISSPDEIGSYYLHLSYQENDINLAMIPVTIEAETCYGCTFKITSVAKSCGKNIEEPSFMFDLDSFGLFDKKKNTIYIPKNLNEYSIVMTYYTDSIYGTIIKYSGYTNINENDEIYTDWEAVTINKKSILNITFNSSCFTYSQGFTQNPNECSDNQYYDDRTGFCKTVICDEGFILNESTKLCDKIPPPEKPNCNENEIYNESSNTCVNKPEPKKVNNTLGVICGENKYYDMELKTCVDKKEACTENQQYDERNKICIEKEDCTIYENKKGKLDVLFVGADYSDETELLNEIKDILGENENTGMFKFSPFKDYKKNFRIKYKIIDEPFPESGMFYDSTAYHYADELCHADKIIYLVPNGDQNGDGRSYALTNEKGGKYMVMLLKSKDNSFLTEYPDITSKTFMHEMGHLYAGLADEYTEEGKPNRAHKPNCAPNNETAKEWWGNITGTGYFTGCSYVEENVRPTENSIMRHHWEPAEDYGPVSTPHIKNILKKEFGG